MARHSRLSPLAPLVAIIAAAAALSAAVAPVSADRLSAFLTPSDLAALRDEAAGGGGGGRKGDGAGASPARVLDAPDLACADERATDGSVTLDVCTGESGAPFGVVVDWMDVLAFARNNGWFRGDDDRLCRLRLTEPVARDACRAVVIGGEEMLGQLRPPRNHTGGINPGQTKSDDGQHSDGGKHSGDGSGSGGERPAQPDDAVLGAESCLDALEPGTYYVFRARARGDRDEGKKQEGTGEQQQQQQQQQQPQEGEGGEDGGEGGEKERRERATDPSLWSDNAVCATLAGGEDDGPDVIEAVPL